MPLDDDPTGSRIEDLDPIPVQSHARARRWEAVLGALLVLGLLGFGVSQWWIQQDQAAHYRTATRAVAAENWDTALTEFAAAGDYNGAPAQLADVRAKIVERDSQYRQATAAVRAGDWVAVLEATARVSAVTAHYRDVDALARQALPAATTAALSGTVALRLDGQPPGLYRWDTNGWHWLLDSDKTSQVRARCPDGGVVYDVPADSGAGTLILPPLGSAADTGPATPATYRRLQLNRTGGGVQARLMLDPDPEASYTCTGAGVWTTRQMSVPLAAPLGGALPAMMAHYQDFASPMPQVPVFPSPDWYAVAVAAQAPVVLVADTSGAVGPRGMMRIYAAAADGSGLRLLVDQPGVLVDTQLSADGAYALLTLAALGEPGQPATYTTFLADTTGRHPAATLAIHGEPAFGYVSPPPRVAYFLNQAPWVDRVLLVAPDGEGRTLRLLDPLAPAQPVFQAGLPETWDTIVQALVDSMTGSLLVLGQRAGAGYSDGVDGIVISQALQARTFHFDSAEWTGMAVRAGSLLTVSLSSVGPGPWQITTRSQPLTALANPVPAGRVIYSDTQRVDQIPLLPVRLAPNWLIYIDAQNGLHGRSYDGQIDLALPWTASGFTDDLWQEP